VPRASHLNPEVLARLIGAGALLASGGIHLDLYLTSYHAIPTIGPLFLVQTASALLIGLVLAVRADQLLSAAGALLAISTLGGYLLSRVVGLFGFHEVGTTAGLTASLLDCTTFVLLGLIATIGSGSVGVIPRRIQQVRALISSRLARLIVPLVGAVALALALLSGGGVSVQATQTPPTSAPSGAVTIVITNFVFIPAHVTVTPGERILIHNNDSVAHTLTATSGTTPAANFNTGDIQPGQTKSIVAPTTSGTYQYLCSIHNFMTGEITVKPK
jgi:plastocyanin